MCEMPAGSIPLTWTTDLHYHVDVSATLTEGGGVW